MSWLGRSPNAKPDYTALEIQTATSTLPIPIVWGQNKLAPNILWYANFRAGPGAGGKGTGGKGGLVGGSSSSESYTYYADLIMGLCEGPINNIGWIYKNQSIYLALELGLGWYDGTTPQTTWPYLAAIYPYNALAYQGTAYLWGAGYNLGDTASIGNHNAEISGILWGTGVNGTDADPAQLIYDFLTNAQYGCGFAAASIDGTTLFGSGGDGSLQTYCKAMGIALSPVLDSQEPASSILTRWLQLLNCAAVWSGGELKFIPYGDTAVAQGAETTYQNQFSIPTPIPLSTGGVPALVNLCSAASFVSDGGVVYAFSNVPMAFIGATAPSAEGTYGMPTPGQYAFATADEGKPVVVTFTAQNLTGYSPDLTPVYALTDSDFVDEKGNKDPVQVERADVFSLPTIQRIEVLNRGNQYAAQPVEARDQSQIEIFGPRVGPTITAHEICDPFIIAPIVAQAILQRELYVRTKFTFKLSWEYCLLDPMDVITITDANLGLSDYPVRVIEIEEDDKGLLAVTCEEFVTGVSTPQFYQTAGSGGYQQNQGVPAVPVNTPFIYEPPLSATGGVAQIWVGASGAPYGSSTQWGGANVYVSVDGVTYSQVATITQAMRQGFLTAALPQASGWDRRHPRRTPRRERRNARGHVAGGGAGGRDHFAGRLGTHRLRDCDADRSQRLQPDRARQGTFGNLRPPIIRPERRSLELTRRSSNTICRRTLPDRRFISNSRASTLSAPALRRFRLARSIPTRRPARQTRSPRRSPPAWPSTSASLGRSDARRRLRRGRLTRHRRGRLRAGPGRRASDRRPTLERIGADARRNDDLPNRHRRLRLCGRSRCGRHQPRHDALTACHPRVRGDQRRRRALRLDPRFRGDDKDPRMSEQLQLRRGTTSQVAAFTPQQGEVVVDTTLNKLHIGDGATAGGWAGAMAQRTAVANAAYSALVTDRIVAYTSLSAAQTVTLPAAASFPVGERLLIIDETGACSTTNTITVSRAGSDTINGQTSLAINVPYGFLALELNGVGAWAVTDSFLAAAGPNGASMQFAVLETLVSGLSGATVTGPSIPANCIVFSVGVRVVTAITGATAYEVGYSGALSAFGSALAIAAGSTNYGLIGPTAFYAATPILLTGTGSFTAGAVRLSIHLMFASPSTS